MDTDSYQLLQPKKQSHFSSASFILLTSLSGGFCAFTFQSSPFSLPQEKFLIATVTSTVEEPEVTIGLTSEYIMVYKSIVVLLLV